MRFIVEVRVEGTDRADQVPVRIGDIDRCAESAPVAGLGLSLQDAKDLTQSLQAVVVAEHAKQFVEAASKCRACKMPLGIKDTKQVLIRKHPQLALE